MALQLFASNSVGTGIRANLGDFDSVFVASGVTVAATSTNDSAIQGTGQYQIVKIEGTVFAGFSPAILLGNSMADIGNAVFIGTTGLVGNVGDNNPSIWMVGTSKLLVNDGKISGGVNFVGNGGPTSSKVINNGLIESTFLAVGRYSGSSTGMETNELTNTGMIRCYGSYAYNGGAWGTDLITNLGTMIGRIELGGDDDLYDGRRGILDGTLRAGNGNDVIYGGSNKDIFEGNAGNDTLDGGGGADQLSGGTGDDVYITDGLDTIIEAAGEGTDTVMAGVTLTLAANVENLVLTGNAAINGTGNELANTITGNSAANILDGATGADQLIGGAGDDVYFTDGGDTIIEAAGQGIDTVKSSVTLTLAANLENLVLMGNAAINGTGNALANTITGNSAANILDGATGADRLVGGAGNDTYITDGGDTIVEAAGQGTDTIRSSVSLTVSANVENLILTGNAAINGTGNVLDNILTGNGAANILAGRAGNDTLTGGAGKDAFVFDTALSKITNIDRITDFSVPDDTIRLENAIFTRLTTVGALSADAFWKSTTGLAHDASDRIIYETDTGKLFYDADGNGAGAAIQFATLVNKAAITAADFLVI